MKKLYVSCPIEGRAYKDISNTVEKMHKIAEAIFGEELEVVSNPRIKEVYGTDLYDLSRRILQMAEADYFISISAVYNEITCLENTIAALFDINRTMVDPMYVMEDSGDRND